MESVVYYLFCILVFVIILFTNPGVIEMIVGVATIISLLVSSIEKGKDVDEYKEHTDVIETRGASLLAITLVSYNLAKEANSLKPFYYIIAGVILMILNQLQFWFTNEKYIKELYNIKVCIGILSYYAFIMGILLSLKDISKRGYVGFTDKVHHTSK